MTAMVMFIGGASRSGKSTVAQNLAHEFGIPVIKLDEINNVIRRSGMIFRFQRIRTTKAICAALIADILKLDADCIIDGGWIDPATAAKLSEHQSFHPVFCGYPDADPHARLALYKNNTEGDNWFSKLPDRRAVKWIKQQVTDSKWYKIECARQDLPYFDFTDIPAGSTALVQHFTKLKQSGEV